MLRHRWERQPVFRGVSPSRWRVTVAFCLIFLPWQAARSPQEPIASSQQGGLMRLNSTGERARLYGRRMVFARLRRCAWLLALVLVTGLASPVLGAGSHCGPAPRPATHGHVDGSSHSHAAPSGHIGSGAAQGGATDGPTDRSWHCPGCLTAACGLSCLGMAVLPAAIDWTPCASVNGWVAATAGAPTGVAPAGDIEPPRPVFVS